MEEEEVGGQESNGLIILSNDKLMLHVNLVEHDILTPNCIYKDNLLQRRYCPWIDWLIDWLKVPLQVATTKSATLSLAGSGEEKYLPSVHPSE